MADQTRFIDLALPAIEKGLSVCRLRPGDKRPLTEGWVEEATNSIAVVESWSAENPSCNCGAVVTAGCGYWVVDVDQLEWLMDSCPREVLPKDTYAVQTGGGGRHYYFAGDPPFDSIKHVKNPDPGMYKKTDGSECKSVMDVVCDRGQVLVAGNVHPKTGRPYTVLQDRQLAECPPAFLAWLRKTVEGKAAEKPRAQGKRQESSVPVLKSWDPFVELRLAGLKYERRDRDGKAFLNYHALMPEGCLKKGGKHHTADGTEEGNECSAFVVRDLGYCWDIGHACFTGCGGGGTVEALAALGIDYAEIAHRPGIRRGVLDRADSIKPVPIDWLWPRYITRGKLTSFAGLQAQGKSPTLRDIAARVSKGLPWPGKKPGEYAPNDLGPQNVVIISFEDDWESVVVPALVASGADMTKVFRFRMTQTADGAEDHDIQLALDQDITELARIVRENEIALVVIDPITSFLGEIDMNSEGKVRPMLDRLSSEVAEANRASVVFSGHLNKKPDLSNPGQRMMGCAAFIGVPRSNIFAADDSDAAESEQYSHVFHPHRTPNKGPTLKYRTKQVSVEIDGKTFPEVIVADWGGETDVVGDILSQAPTKAERSKYEEAGEEVAKMLRAAEGNRLPVSVIGQHMNKAGYSDMWVANSSRIMKKVPAESFKDKKVTYWKLKSKEEPKQEQPKQETIFDKEDM